MICGLLKSEIGYSWRSVVRYIDKSVSRAMGCFFACFRIKEDGHRPPHLVSDSARSISREAVVSKNRLSSLFLNEEKEDSQAVDRRSVHLDSPEINKEIRDEAKFLKTCGTLPETPVELRKTSEKLKFHSLLPNSSISKLQMDKKIDQSPSPVKLFEGWSRDSISSERTPSSCISNVNNTGMISISSSEDREADSSLTSAIKVHPNQIDYVTMSTYPLPSAANIQNRNKSVRFDCDFDPSSSNGSSSENGWQSLKKFESPGDQSVSKPSLKPTPLKLSDDMQTPGTVFPANIDILANGKTRIRSQYVYSVLNPVENVSQWHILKEDDFNPHQLVGEFQGSIDQFGKQAPNRAMQLDETFSVKDLKVEASLSSWFKPAKSAHDDDNSNVGTSSSRSFHFGRTPGDRPIIGMVAAHWNENQTSHISPKWWDGNGIPNSTNKYKEDQKVNWHATPFEERLEKALSEECLVSQKKNISGKPLVLDESDEKDTAFSQLQASMHSKSVVSF